MPASLIFRFARVSRPFMVSDSTRKARAISSVLRPPSARSVRATCASSASAGWQHMKISSSRSSGNSGSSTSCSSDSGSSSSFVFSARVRSRRIRSTARRRAVVVSQAPGLSGVPSRVQRSAATANASWVASSARSKSPKSPTRVARTRPHSSRKTWSISGLALHDRTHLDGAAHARRRDARGNCRGLVEVVGLEQEETAEVLLGVDERAVAQQCIAVVDAHRGRRTRQRWLLAAEDARHPGELFVLADHSFQLFLREFPDFRRVVDEERVLHGSLLGEYGFVSTTNGPALRGHDKPEQSRLMWTRWMVAGTLAAVGRRMDEHRQRIESIY